MSVRVSRTDYEVLVPALYRDGVSDFNIAKRTHLLITEVRDILIRHGVSLDLSAARAVSPWERDDNPEEMRRQIARRAAAGARRQLELNAEEARRGK